VCKQPAVYCRWLVSSSLPRPSMTCWRLHHFDVWYTAVLQSMMMMTTMIATASSLINRLLCLAPPTISRWSWPHSFTAQSASVFSVPVFDDDHRIELVTLTIIIQLWPNAARTCAANFSPQVICSACWGSSEWVSSFLTANQHILGYSVWNSLPDDLRAQQDYVPFKQGLKIWLFSRY